MAASTKELSKKERNGAWELTSGQTDLSTPAIGLITALKDSESTPGPIAGSIKATGRIINYTGMESTLGLTVEGTKENILTTRRKATESTHGQTVRFMMASGETESSTEKRSSQILKERAN